MEKLTYKQAYNKIIDAYLKDEIQPFDSKFCFCGTLCNNTSSWCVDSNRNIHNDSHGYIGSELGRMEAALFNPLDLHLIKNGRYRADGYEDALFEGMCAALDVLKQVHMEHGEVTDDLPFTKRQLQAL